MPTKVGYSLGTDLEKSPADAAPPPARRPEAPPMYPAVVAPPAAPNAGVTQGAPGSVPQAVAAAAFGQQQPSSVFAPVRPAMEPHAPHAPAQATQMAGAPASQPRHGDGAGFPQAYIPQAHGQYPVYSTPAGGVPPSQPAAPSPSGGVLQIPAAGAPSPSLQAPVAPIEVVLVDENTPPPRGQVWRVLEIWTRNRIYLLDAQLNCVEVLSRQSGKPESHQFLGAKLGGGQRREGDKLRLSHPLPVPGTEAVFKLPNNRRGPFGQTSKVERVVLRVRVAQVSLLQAEPAWAEITGQYRVVGD